MKRTVLFAVAVFLHTAPAGAAMQVLDSTNLAKNAAIASTNSRILNTNSQTLAVLQQILDSTGLSGGYGSGQLGGLLKAAGAGGLLSGGGLTGGSAVMEDAAPLLDMVFQAVSLGGDIGSGRPVDFNSALSLLQRAFRTYDGMDNAGRRYVQNRALGFYRQSVDDAAALAVVNRETAVTGGGRVERLMEQARQAENTNERLGVISAQLGVLTDETIQLRALMAGFVQAEMGDRIANTPRAGGDSLLPEEPVPAASSAGIFD